MFGGSRALVCAALAVLVALAAATPANAVRSNRGAKPSVTILTKDERTVLRTAKLSLRVGVGIAPTRLRLRGLGLDLARRPMRIINERKITFRHPHSRVINLKLTKQARSLIQLARLACRDVRISAFVASRRLGVKRDDQRTTLVRHSKTLKHGRKDCGTGPPPGLPPGFGVPGGDSTGGGGGIIGPPPVTDPGEPITIKVGAASADATPPVGTPMFAYTSRSQLIPPNPNNFQQLVGDPDEGLYAKTFVPSRGIHTRILARALVIESAGRKFALAQVDLGGLPLSLTQEVLKRVSGTGITAERLMLSATHTHSSSGAIWSVDNMGYGGAGGDVYDPRVFSIVADGIAEAITAANSRLEPGRIGVGTSQLRGASRNRGFDAFVRNPDVPKDPNAARDVSIDPQVTVIRADAADGRPLAAWSNFAVHPTSLGGDNALFSGDNPGTTERLVEEAITLDGAARGAAPKQRPFNIRTKGPEGDVSPDGGALIDATEPERIGDASNPHRALDHVASGFPSANSAGRKVALGVLAAWYDAGQAMRGSPAVDARHTYMSFDGSAHGADTQFGNEPVGPVPVLGVGAIEDGDIPGYGRPCAPVDNFAGPGQGRKLPLYAGPGSIPHIHPASLMKLGPLAIAAFPTEITTQMGRRIRAAVAAEAGPQAPKGAVLAAMTNSYNSYTSTPEEYDHCHYEGGFTLWGRQQGSKYRDVARTLAKALFGGAALPASTEPPQVSPGTGNQPSPRQTTSPGQVVTDVPGSVARLGQVQFKWRGGDTTVDAPRGRPFVTLERRIGGSFQAVATEDSVFDTTRVDNDVWTETWQFMECDALGTYRFVVRGVSSAGAYRTESKAFELTRNTRLASYSATVTGGIARVRAEYTGFPAAPLAVLPKRVRHGFAILRVTRPDGAVEEIPAFPDSNGLEFRASVPSGSSVKVVSIEDACGNTGS
jgi:neutral ceramidase